MVLFDIISLVQICEFKLHRLEHPWDRKKGGIISGVVLINSKWKFTVFPACIYQLFYMSIDVLQPLSKLVLVNSIQNKCYCLYLSIINQHQMHMTQDIGQ